MTAIKSGAASKERLLQQRSLECERLKERALKAEGYESVCFVCLCRACAIKSAQSSVAPVL